MLAKKWMLLLLCAGCAGPLSSEKDLQDAQKAVARASTGEAAKREPTRVYEARRALTRAENAYDDEQPYARDLAYIAMRKAEQAEAAARIDAARETRMRADQERRTLESPIVQGAHERMQQAEERAQQAQQQAEQERATRIEVEQRMKQALDDLARATAAVKEEQRGTVITLTGSVLFPSNRNELLPTARSRLNDVAEALKIEPEREITIEGHTDNQGATDHNIELSQRRADSVRMYLISRGVPADKIQAVGLGPARPVADNRTAEGRANNRRVEIIIAPPEK